ncbi:hypothetical protein NDU88_001123 [Pleurodeles waltl]|uniref:Uncharacterized protein n=1 Tax=Pleurodeles waltl TaxID=8319 RepID=A0AAV7S9L2_PLEWA|nr:hypothetical protein NDU88_001123 [Pleurodeles waltl]
MREHTCLPLPMLRHQWSEDLGRAWSDAEWATDVANPAPVSHNVRFRLVQYYILHQAYFNPAKINQFFNRMVASCLRCLTRMWTSSTCSGPAPSWYITGLLSLLASPAPLEFPRYAPGACALVAFLSILRNIWQLADSLTWLSSWLSGCSGAPGSRGPPIGSSPGSVSGRTGDGGERCLELRVVAGSPEVISLASV